MSSSDSSKASGDLLLEMRGLRIEGQSGRSEWQEIIKGIDITCIAARCWASLASPVRGNPPPAWRPWVTRTPGAESAAARFVFDGMDLMAASEEERRKLRGVKIAYVAQSAAASFNPAHKLIDQFAEIPVKHGKSTKDEAEADAKDLYGRLVANRIRTASVIAIPTRYRAASCSAR